MFFKILKKNLPLLILFFLANSAFAISSVALWTYPDIPNSDVATDFQKTGATIVNQEYLTLSNSGELKQTYAFSPTKIAELKSVTSNLYTTISGGLTGMRALFSAGMDRTTNTKLDSFLTGVVNFVTSQGITGADIDFEKFGSWTEQDWSNYKTFIQMLGNDLHSAGKKLQIDGPAIINTTYQGYFKWKYEELPESSIDRIVVMAYDQMYDNGGTNAVATLNFIKDSANWIKNKISDDSKIVIGLNSYGYRTRNGNIWNVKILTKDQIFQIKSPSENTYVRDSASRELHFFDGTDHFWYSDSESIDAKKSAVDSTGLGKISFWHAGGGNFKAHNITPPLPTCVYSYGPWTPEICQDGTQTRTETKSPQNCQNGNKESTSRTCTVENQNTSGEEGGQNNGSQENTDNTENAEGTGSSSSNQPCTFNSETVQSNASVTGYKTATVPAGQVCQYEIRVCNNGVLSGTFQYDYCQVEQETQGPVLGGTPDPSEVNSGGTNSSNQNNQSSTSSTSARRRSSGGGRVKKEYVCKNSKALNYKSRGIHKESLCIYPKEEVKKNIEIINNEESLNKDKVEKVSLKSFSQTGKCPASLMLTQNLRAPKYRQRYIRNGKYDWYTKGIVKEAHILQKHLNRLGFSAGEIDGVIGPKTKGAIIRMQKFLGTKQDGLVGEKTREKINNSCGNLKVKSFIKNTGEKASIKSMDNLSENIFSGKKCPNDLILTQNMQAPVKNGRWIVNGKYSKYTGAIVKEAHILQKHLNRLGFNAGQVDGVIGPKTTSAILRMQKRLGVKQDGYIGPKTRERLNNSCK